jgi:putative tricarboxylic transport membrane protein
LAVHGNELVYMQRIRIFMKKADQGSGLVLLVIAGFISWGSISLPYGNIHNPGPGFFPLWLGIILGTMAVGLVLKSTWQKEKAKLLQDILSEEVRWGKVFFVLMALILYAYLMNFFGFLIVTFLLMAFLLYFIEPHPWKTVVGWTLIGAFGSYLIFEVWMKLRLPKGFLGI